MSDQEGRSGGGDTGKQIQGVGCLILVVLLVGFGVWAWFGSRSSGDALQKVWDSYDTVQRKALCGAAIQNGQNFYGPARGLAAVAGNGITENDAQQFLLEPSTCPDEWLNGG